MHIQYLVVSKFVLRKTFSTSAKPDSPFSGRIEPLELIRMYSTARAYGNLHSHVRAASQFPHSRVFFLGYSWAFIMHSQILVRILRIHSRVKWVFLDLIFLQPKEFMRRNLICNCRNLRVLYVFKISFTAIVRIKLEQLTLFIRKCLFRMCRCKSSTFESVFSSSVARQISFDPRTSIL